MQQGDELAVAQTAEQQITHTQEDSIARRRTRWLEEVCRHGDVIILDMLKCCFLYFI